MCVHIQDLLVTGVIVGKENVKDSMALREQTGRDESFHSWVDGVFPPQVVRLASLFALALLTLTTYLVFLSIISVFL